MAKLFVWFAATIAVCLAQGPSQPDSRGSCDEQGNKVVDTDNMCWYHECVNTEDEGLKFMPRRCALGSKVSYNFVQGPENPCTINFDDVIGYNCNREQPSVDGPPPCFESNVRPQCYNEGQAVYEADKCWCDCLPSWQGHHDCSLPTAIDNLNDLAPGSNICVDGEPQADWCQTDPQGGCMNGATCYNQCDTFWCDCPNHESFDYYGKRCENRR